MPYLWRVGKLVTSFNLVRFSLIVRKKEKKEKKNNCSCHILYFIHTDYIDNYQDLVFKAMGWMKWVTEYCGSVDFIVKSDDDILIDIFGLEQYLKTNELTKDEAKFHCYLWRDGVKVRTNPNNKW